MHTKILYELTVDIKQDDNGRGVFHMFLIEIILILAVISSGLGLFPSEKVIIPSGVIYTPIGIDLLKKDQHQNADHTNLL